MVQPRAQRIDPSSRLLGGHSTLTRTLMASALLTLAPTANAQRTQENAVTAAGDAFGTVVGNQTIGLYSPTSARGFSPTDAANLRIEGLYFDQQTAADPYLFSGTDMRVGISAQSYAFASPSGIADLRLRTPSGENGASVVLNRGPLGQQSAEIDTQFSPLKSLSIGLNAGQVRDFDYLSTPLGDRRAISSVVRFRAGPDTEIIPFFGYIHSSERQFVPAVYANGVDPLPVFDTHRLPAQAWTSAHWNQITAGLLVKVPITGPWSVRAGVFHSAEDDGQVFSDLLLGLQPGGTAQHVADISPGLSSHSYSGDLRVTRSWSEAKRDHKLTFAARFRDVKRRYGGDSITELGDASIHQNVGIAKPMPLFTNQSRDRVRQTGLGINYNERWEDRASLNLGVLRTDYYRNLQAADIPSAHQHAMVTLPMAGITTNVSKNFELYASYTRGLEDSTVAPSSAQNRGEPPPAAPTWQVDGGARISLLPDLQLLAGAFKIHKSYFNLDTAGLYSRLGEISSRGIEASGTWTGPEGLTIIVGACWLKPEATRLVEELGGGGTTAVGPVPRTVNVNIDYAPPAWKGWGTSLQWTSLSSRVETNSGLYKLPPLVTLNLVTRYYFRRSNRSYSVRFEADNVTNETGLLLSTTYNAFSQPRRNYMVTLAADF